MHNDMTAELLFAQADLAAEQTTDTAAEMRAYEAWANRQPVGGMTGYVAWTESHEYAVRFGGAK